jgi:hypothetical protein
MLNPGEIKILLLFYKKEGQPSFFFEKKNQKTFIHFGLACGG